MKPLIITAAAGAIVLLAAGARFPADQEPDGKALYEQHCRKCHGATGTPSQRMTEMYATLRPLSEIQEVSADSIVALLVVGGTEGMKSYKDKMTPAELKAVADYALALSKPQGS